MSTETERLNVARTTVASCVSLIAAVTGQSEPIMGKWLDLYYQIRHAYELERGAAEEPQLLRKEDLYGALREILKEALGKPGKTDCHVAGAPRNDGKCETVVEAKDPGPWVKYKRRILDKLRAAREAGIPIAKIAAASGGALSESRITDAINAAKLSREEWSALEKAVDLASAAAAGRENGLPRQ